LVCVFTTFGHANAKGTTAAVCWDKWGMADIG
jgi:hypothetical protein